MIVNALEDMAIMENEFCFTVEKQYWGNGSFTVTIPKLMPLMGGSIKTVTSNFNNNIFINDAACKPVTSNSMSTQGFITVPRSPNCSLEHKKSGIDELIPSGTRLVCSCMNKNYKNMTITDSY